MNSLKLIIASLFISIASANAKQYYGSVFGMRSDGKTVNTGSLQKAIDYISTESPGDTLTLWVGRYVTGTVFLKSNVTIQLREGAILVGTNSAHDYITTNGTSAILVADGQENITIYGLGVIDGNSTNVNNDIKKQSEKNFLQKGYINPSLISMNNCKNINIDGIVLQSGCNGAQIFNGCSNVNINNVSISATNNGITLNNNNNITISNSYFDITGEAVKSNGDNNFKTENCKTPNGKL